VKAARVPHIEIGTLPALGHPHLSVGALRSSTSSPAGTGRSLCLYRGRQMACPRLLARRCRPRGAAHDLGPSPLDVTLNNAVDVVTAGCATVTRCVRKAMRSHAWCCTASARRACPARRRP
jgi:hypothetical protein